MTGDSNSGRIDQMVVIKSDEEIAAMRKSGRILVGVLDRLRMEIKPGVETGQLDRIVADETEKRGAVPSFKNYRGFPANLCVSVNDEIVHGIPGGRILEEGDIVSLDVGVKLDGLHTDAAVTIGVGRISREAEELISVTEGSLREGMARVADGVSVDDISTAIQQHVESRGFSVVREYSGHGVGRDLHEDPEIPNFSTGRRLRLRRGMTLAIEPMVNAGDWHTRVADNNWTVITADGSLSAHFEHTVAVDDDRAEILA